MDVAGAPSYTKDCIDFGSEAGYRLLSDPLQIIGDSFQHSLEDFRLAMLLAEA
jgi:hypothetical protein